MSAIISAVRTFVKSYAKNVVAREDGTEFRFCCQTPDNQQWRSRICVYPDAKFLRLEVFVSDPEYDDALDAEMAKLPSLLTEQIVTGAFYRQSHTDAFVFTQFVDLREQLVTVEAVERWMNLSSFPLMLWRTTFDYVRAWNGTAEECFERALVEAGCSNGKVPLPNATEQERTTDDDVNDIIENLLREVNERKQKFK